MAFLRKYWRTFGVVLMVLTLFLAVGLAWEAANDANDTIGSLEAERKERTDQNCELFERLHLRDVQDYADSSRGFALTLDFIQGLTPEQRREPLNALIIAQLPETRKDFLKEEREAHIDIAPNYCDLPGAVKEAMGAKPVGLPEPDPVVPERPKVVQDYFDSLPPRGR